MSWPWPVLETVVEHGLGKLLAEVTKARPGVESRFGIASRSDRSHVYVYRSFYPAWKGAGYDAVVAGVSFTLTPAESLRIQADIVGEGTGTILEEKMQVVGTPYEALLVAYDFSHDFGVVPVQRWLDDPERDPD